MSDSSVSIVNYALLVNLFSEWSMQLYSVLTIQPYAKTCFLFDKKLPNWKILRHSNGNIASEKMRGLGNFQTYYYLQALLTGDKETGRKPALFLYAGRYQ